MKLLKPILLTSAILILSGCSNSISDQSESIEQNDGYSEISSVSQSSEQTGEPTVNKEPIPFDGLGKQTFITGNLPVNTKLGLHSAFFCAADGEIFFTNFKDRGYLYKITESGAELVVEKSACFINYFDGKLYFLSSDSIAADNIDFTGAMYRYDLESGSCETICAEEIRSLTVSEDGIYYSVKLSDNANSSVYEIRLMDFDGSSQKCFYDPSFRYGKYLIGADGITDLTKEENLAQPSYESIIPFSAEISNVVGTCICDDNLIYYDNDKSLVLRNLCDGTTVSVPRKGINELYGGESMPIIDYTLCGGYLYLTHSSSMLTVIDLETMQMSKVLVGGCGGKVIDRLYTDGGTVYVLLRNTQLSDPELVRLTDNGDQLTAEKLG